MEGKWPSLSLLDRRICSLFFYWSTWTVFLGAMLVRRPIYVFFPLFSPVNLIK